MFKKLIFAAMFAVFASPLLATEALVLNQEESPLKIVGYTVSYKSPDRGIGDGTIVHRLTLENPSGASVVAYGVGFRTFDSFKRSMGRPFIGYDMSGVAVGSKATPIWENRALSAYLFRGYGIGVAYVSIVRMEDGTIWRADSNSISNQLTDLELDLTTPEDFE